MYLRMVQAKINTASLPQFRRLYEENVIPALGSMEGCIHASLLQSTDRPEECISFTLWQQRRHADAYEASGIFSKLLAEASQFFEGSSEWDLHLGSDLTLRYDPVPEEPVVKAFHLPTNPGASILPRDPSVPIYIRIVTPQIREGKMAEFRHIYTEAILPQIRSAKGCLHAYLVENLRQKDQVISLSIWDRKQSADNYEQSGLFSTLTHQVEHCFPEMHQLKQQLERESRSRIVTSEELSVEGYEVITGKSFL